MASKLIQQGAEAKIILDETKNQIIKDRIPKSYRIKILDDKIRKQRTKSETKLLIKASQIINAPLPIINNSDKNNLQITMPFIDGKKLSQYLEEFPLEKQKRILKQIGEAIAKLHDADIIHGDLTTSNMILVEDNYKPNKLIKDNSKEKEVIFFKDFAVYFIDFGLGFFNGKFEDKAVDIHLLKQALEAKHFAHWQENYQAFLEGYKTSKNYEKTLNQLIKVEKRGRYRN